MKAFGKLDVFVGSAGVGAGNLSVVEVLLDKLEAAVDELYAINVTGCLLGAARFCPRCCVPAAT